MIARLFAYGTLMRGLEYHRHLIENGGRFECEASIRGRLYVCEYPALVAAEDAQVRGELYVFDDIERALTVVDEIELEGTMYHRIVALAARDGGTAIEAYVYRYADSVRSCRLVESGDYRDFINH